MKSSRSDANATCASALFPCPIQSTSHALAGRSGIGCKPHTYQQHKTKIMPPKFPHIQAKPYQL
eukprot:5032250-Amphidinium_carterae.1